MTRISTDNKTQQVPLLAEPAAFYVAGCREGNTGNSWPTQLASARRLAASIMGMENSPVRKSPLQPQGGGAMTAQPLTCWQHSGDRHNHQPPEGGQFDSPGQRPCSYTHL